MIKTIEGYSYRVNQWIGKGYSSTVHKGKRDSTGEEVSLKVIQMSKLQDPINQMLLQHEITALKSLTSSQHVLRLYNVYGTRNNTYIVTELMEGDLHSLIKQKKQFPYYEAVEVIKQIITGYYDVHKSGYLHRDIKPANIFYKKDKYKIGDFGFAIPATDAHNHRHYNVGSPVYMPPQALKENIYTTSCDTWAIGIIFYQLLKGLAPWRAASEQKLYDKIISEPLHQLTLGLPEIARVFLSKVLHLDQIQRMTPQELITWPQKLFAVQIRGAPQTKIMKASHLPLGQIQMNNFSSQNQPSFCSRSKSYSTNQVPSYISGLRANLNNCQINTYQTKNQQKITPNMFLIPPSPQNNMIANYESAKQPSTNWQKTSTFFTPADLPPKEQQIQTPKSQSMNVQFYATNMISYIKFINRVIKFISDPTQVPLRDLEMSLIKFLFKQIEAIKRIIESEGNLNQVQGWKEFVKTNQCDKILHGSLKLLTKKYKMFLVLPKNQFVLDIYREQLLDGIQKVYSYFQKGNHSDKELIALDYLVSFYQVWDYREKKGLSFNFKEFLQFSKFDNIMNFSPYDVKKQHFAQLKMKMKSLRLIGQTIESPKGMNPISIGLARNQVKNNNKENYLMIPIRY